MLFSGAASGFFQPDHLHDLAQHDSLSSDEVKLSSYREKGLVQSLKHNNSFTGKFMRWNLDSSYKTQHP